MLTPAEWVDLQPRNTLALPARARWFSIASDLDDIAAAVRWASERELPLLVLGGGSNVVLAADWPGLVLQIALRGRRIVAAAGDAVVVEAAAGENWHELVQWTLAQGLEGLENLTLIPGTVGAAPIQNIGAYGVELADRLIDVRGWSLETSAERELTAAECQLGYRDSIFKQALRDRFIVTAIRLRLQRRASRVVDYPALREALAAAGVAPERASAAEVERAVRAVRSRKLPDPAALPNAGSFFKNPVIPRSQYEALLAQWPSLPAYAAADGRVKLPAGWLLEQAGWKSHRAGSVGVHAEQALVLVHFGGGDGAALLALAAAIQRDVLARFGIALEPEPRVYGADGAGRAHAAVAAEAG